MDEFLKSIFKLRAQLPVSRAFAIIAAIIALVVCIALSEDVAAFFASRSPNHVLATQARVGAAHNDITHTCGTPAAQSLAASETKKKGEELRSRLQSQYELLLRTRALKSRNDISSIVAEYIPTGTSFIDARAILEVARMNIRELAYSETLSTVHGSAELRWLFIPVAGISIDLTPLLPHDFCSPISEITAFILHESI